MNKQSMYEQLVIQTQMNYSRYYGVYANGSTPVKLTEKQPLPYDEQIQLFAQKIKEADHIIVGGASGLSAVGGGDFYYTDSASYKKALQNFMKSMDLSVPLQGCSILGIVVKNFGATWQPF